MPIQRNDEKKIKITENNVEKMLSNEALDKKVAENNNKVAAKKKKLSPKTKYVLSYIAVCLIGLAVALLIIALINLGVHGKFEI
ncbi:MAG: hypothetical protein RR578_01625 [Bacilli bacterium]